VTTGRGRKGVDETDKGAFDGVDAVVAIVLEAVVDEVAGVDLGEDRVDTEGVEAEVEAARDDDSAGEGSVNSTGLTRGVACTLVINLARLQ